MKMTWLMDWMLPGGAGLLGAGGAGLLGPGGAGLLGPGGAGLLGPGGAGLLLPGGAGLLDPGSSGLSVGPLHPPNSRHTKRLDNNPAGQIREKDRETKIRSTLSPVLPAQVTLISPRGRDGLTKMAI